MTTTTIQVINFILVLIGLYVWFRMAQINLLLSVAPLALLIHYSVFYLILWIFPLDAEAVNIWSAALRMQGIFTLIITGLQIKLESQHGK